MHNHGCTALILHGFWYACAIAQLIIIDQLSKQHVIKNDGCDMERGVIAPLPRRKETANICPEFQVLRYVIYSFNMLGEGGGDEKIGACMSAACPKLMRQLNCCGLIILSCYTCQFLAIEL